MNGYTFQYQGKNLGITVLDCVADYEKLLPQLVYDEDYLYYITKERIFVYLDRVIASGTFSRIQHEPEGLSVKEWIKRKHTKMRYGTVDMSNRRKYQYEEKIEERPTEEVKEENPEWFEIEKVESMEFKTADTGETVMEISIPTANELDNYFSSIGYDLSF